MTGTQTLIARGVLGLLAVSAGSVALSIGRFREGAARSFDRCATWVFAVSRFGIFFITYFVLHLAPRGDIPAYYLPEATAVLHGQLPYRDFPSSYAPLHPYLDAIIVFFWRSPLAIILFAILAEGLLLRIWLPLARSFLPEQRVRTAAILYLTSPISLQFVAIDGQDNVVIALLLATAMLLLYRKRDAASGMMLGLGIVLIKFLPLLYVCAFLAAARRRLQWLAGCAGVLLFGYGAFAWMRLPLLFPVYAEGQLKGAGNLPFLIESISGIPLPPVLTNGLLVVVLLTLLALIARALRITSPATRMQVLTSGCAALTIALVLFSKKSWPPYLVLALFPICITVTEKPLSKLRLAAFLLFSVVAVTEHSLWASILEQAPAASTHDSLVALQPATLLFLLLEIILLAGYAWLLSQAVQQIRGMNQRLTILASDTL
jgi:hypothetical protein